MTTTEATKTPLEQLATERANHPELHEALDEMMAQFEAKLYHQLTGSMLKYLGQRCFVGSPEVEAFCKNFVQPIEKNINPVRLLEILRLQYEAMGASRAVEVMDEYKEYFESDRDTKIMWSALKANFLARLNRFEEASDILESLQQTVNDAHGMHAVVSASYHRAWATLHKAVGKPEEFCKSALLYLAFTSLNDLSDEEKTSLAYEIGISSLIGPDIYNFGELMQQAVFDFLKSTPKAWLYDVLEAFKEGQQAMYDEVLVKHKAPIAESELKDHVETIMRDKMTLLALMELTFRKPKKQRKLAFDEIAEHCRVPLDKVEIVVMKAMASNLIKGQIDQVDRTVRLTWVRPRILDKGRLGLLSHRMGTWSRTAKTILINLECLTTELLVS